MVQLSSLQHAGLIQAFSEMGDEIDVLIIDTAAGIGDSVVSFVRAAQEVLLVVTDEPTSITDAYALIKLLNRDYGISRFRVLANMAHAPQEGRNLFAKLTKVTERFLDVALQYVGAVPLRRGRAQGGTETACGLRGLSALEMRAGLQGHRTEDRYLAVARNTARPSRILRGAPHQSVSQSHE